MPKTWSDTDDKRLLLAMLQTVAPTVTAANWTAVAEMLGNDLTASACMQHYNKKLKLLKTSAITSAGDTATTPQSAKSKSAKPTSTSKKRKTAPKDADNESDIDSKSPTDAKTKNTAATKVVKTEKDEDEDEIIINFDAE